MDKLGLFSPSFRNVPFEWFRHGLFLGPFYLNVLDMVYF